ALDVHLARGVDQDVADVGVAHQRLDGAEAVHLVEDLLAELLARALREGQGLLLDQLGGRAAPLGIRASHVHTSEVAEVDAVDQLAVDAELQLLVAAVGRSRARARDDRRGGLLLRSGGRCGLADNGESVSQIHACTLSVRPNSLRSSWPGFGFPAPGTPATLVARSAIASASFVGLPLSGAPRFIASAADASSRGIMKKGVLPMARVASWMLTGPPTASVTTSSTRSAGIPRRASRSAVRRADRMPGTDRSLSSRMRWLASMAAMVAPVMVRAVSTTV